MNIEKKISEVFLELGIPANQLGYEYAKAAIAGCYEGKFSFHEMMGLYEILAEEFNTKPGRVERAIRHSLETAWNYINSDISYKYFGNSIFAITGKPTNSQFIATILNFIKHDE